MLSDCCCSLYAIIALLASRLSSLLLCVFRSSLHAVRSTLPTFCLWQHVTRYSLFAVRCWLFASRCSVFVSRCLVLVSRYSPACCSLRKTYCTLLVIPYSPLTAQLSLLSSGLVSSADRCTSSRIVHPCSRCVIRFLPRKSPPHWCSSLAAVCLLFRSQHANRLSHLVSCCSQIPVRNLLFSARRSLRAAQFLFFASLCVPLGSCYSYLAARRLLLSIFIFFN